MRKYFVIFFLITLLLTVSACKKDTKQTGPFKGGINGVEISFLPTAPPSEFNSRDTVPVKVLLKNKGERDVAEGEAKVQLFGIHYPSFGLSEEYRQTSGKLIGISEFVTEGGEQQVDIGVISYNKEIINFEEFQLKARVCYPYSTKAQLNVCISSLNLEQGGAEKVCSVSGEKLGKNDVSSAPIQITRVTEKLRGSDQLLFDISIENKGKGLPYRNSMECSDLNDAIKKSDNENIVVVKVPEDIKCSFLGETASTGELRLTEGKKILTCRRNVPETGSNFEQKLTITLEYKYVDTTTKSIKIFETST